MKKPPTNRLHVLAATGLFIFAMLLLAVSVSRRFIPDTPDYDETIFEPHAVTLAPGIHLLGELAPGAAYVVETDEGLVLIDTGLEADGSLLVKQLSDLGLELDQLRIILLTHVHGDHSLGAQRLRQLTGAKVYAGAGDAHELESGTPREAFFSTFYMPGVETHPTEVDVLLEGGEVIEMGDAKFQAIATPGHTPGSFCFLLERNDQRVLFTGDMVTSLTSGLGTYAAYLSPRYRGDAEDYLASLEKLRAMPPPDLVMPGHPRMDRVGQSPRLTSEEWHALLDRGIEEMRELVELYVADGRDFLDDQPKEILPGLYYLGEFHEWAIYCLIKDSQRFIFNAPGGPGLDEFVRSHLEQLDASAPPLSAVLLTCCDDDAISGLFDLVGAGDCHIIAPAAVLDELRKDTRTNLQWIAAEKLKDEDLFSVEATPLFGLGQSSVAYRFTWQNKNVLVTGRIPAQITESSVEELAVDLFGADGDPRKYVDSLEAIKNFKPDIWLPAQPVHGQNANLYGTQWQDILRSNFALFQRPPN